MLFTALPFTRITKPHATTILKKCVCFRAVNSFGYSLPVYYFKDLRAKKKWIKSAWVNKKILTIQEKI